MAEAVKAGRKIDLAAVLRLCKWVVEQPLDGYGAYIPVDGVLWKLVDKDWQWARYAICRFIRAVCDPMSDGVPQYPLEGNREAIGSLLKPLAEEPDQVSPPRGSRWKEPAGVRRFPDRRDQYAPRYRGGGDCRLCTLDCQPHCAGGGRPADCAGGFDAMPEVRERLEWQITPENASFEAFAVIGAYFGLLHWIDESWVKANAERIFDLIVIEREPKSATVGRLGTRS